MKIVFVSNFLNHHQIPFCEEMCKLCDEFWFVATEKSSSQGYQKSFDAEYLVDYKENPEQTEELIRSSDVVIFGACPNSLIELRMKENKLSFLYSERFFKKGMWRRFIPKTYKKVYNRILKYRDNNIYALCASGFLHKELSELGFPKEKCYKWGYFPNAICGEKRQRTKNSILWAGRMLDWKHPEIPVLVAEKLKRMGYDFTLNIVGEGPMYQKLYKKIRHKKLETCVKLMGSKEHSELMKLMAEHEIFMFTSDKNEGWGAVLNEAMGNGCAVVASDAVGSAPFLVKKGENGLTFKSKNVKDACKKVKTLLEDRNLMIKISKNAQQDIKETWNYEVAAKNFYHLAETLLENKNGKIYDNGPCSLAESKGRNF